VPSNSYLQDAKVGNADFAALLQDATDVGHEAGEHLDRLLLGYAVISPPTQRDVT